MDTVEKVQKVIEVADGRAHPSELKDLLPEPGAEEPNFIKLAVDHLVNQSLQAGISPEYFRFKIVEGKTETFTPWRPEVSQFTAPMAMGGVRREHPGAAIVIERSSNPE